MSPNHPQPTTARRPGAHAEVPYSRRELDIFASLRTHWLLACALFTVAACGLGFLALQQERLTFTSTAALRVARAFPRTLQVDRELELGSSYDYDSFRNDQVALLLRPDVLSDALQRCDQSDGVWAVRGAPEAMVLQNFARALSVASVPKSSRIEIALQSTDWPVLQPALAALLEAFEAAHRREYFFADDARPQVLRTTLTAVEASIEEKRALIQELSERLGVTNFGISSVNPWLAQLELARQNLQIHERSLERAQLERDALQAALAAPTMSADLLSGATAWGEVSPGLQSVLNTLASRHAAVRTELQTLGADHPGRAALERELSGLERQAVQTRVGLVESLLLAADATVLEATAMHAATARELASIEEQNNAFLAGFQQGRILEEDLPRDLDLRSRLNERLEFFEVESQSPSYAEVAQSATEVDPQGASNLKRNLALALFLAIALALGLPVLWDWRDDRVHTPDDAQRALGVPLAGWLPRTTRAGMHKLRLSQTQRVAQTLDRERKHHGARIIVLTAVKEGDPLALARAVSESLCDLGRRVLVVDAIGGQPGEHSGNTGLIGLLAGDPLQPIPMQDDGDFLPRGNSAGGIPAWDAWSQILSNAAASYDFVLVAGPALLASPAAELLVTDADVSLLVVKAESERLGEVGRAGQILHALKPKAICAVLTNLSEYRSRGEFRQMS